MITTRNCGRGVKAAQPVSHSVQFCWYECFGALNESKTTAGPLVYMNSQ